MNSSLALQAQLSSIRKKRLRRRHILLGSCLGLLFALFCLSLMLGQSYVAPGTVLRVLLGEHIPGVTFTVASLRLPRAVLSMLAGFSFGLAGAAYQTLLRNSLASPDIIGISHAASAAAVVAIVFFSLGGTAVSLVSVVTSIAVAALIYILSYKRGAAGARLILVGIGIAAILQSVISFTLSKASEWNYQEALRWLSGSVNGASWPQIAQLAIALPLLAGILFFASRDLETLRLGDDSAAALGVRVQAVHFRILIAATGLVAFATAAAGPISFVAFLSAPIAGQIFGRRASLLLPAACIGALLVLAADYCGQFLLPARLPVGVITGALGAPYLVYLIIRSNKAGGGA